MARITLHDDPSRDGREMIIFFERQFDPAVQASIIREALKDAAKQFAEKWLEDNKDRVIERLNVDAIANMILLEVSKDVKDNILGKDKS